MVLSDILFIVSKGSVSYYSLRNLGCDIVEPYHYRGRLAFKMRFLFHLIKLEFFLPSYRINDKIKKRRPKMIVISGSLIFVPYIKALRKLFPTVKILLFYPNVVSDPASISPVILKKYNIIPYSWDSSDCKKYSLRYMKPSFEMKLLPHSIDNKYDVCFIGADKGRYKNIKYLQKLLDDLNLKYYIRITADRNFLTFLHSYYSSPIPYPEYLEIVSSSRCIIDLVRKGQVGTTTRVMEALFGRKKLISNNLNLRNYDFYNPRNIFILGVDSVDNLKSFIEGSFEPISPSILNEYTPSFWLNRVLKEDD